MKALVLEKYGPPAGAFALRERPDPVPGPGQVRIAVEAFGLNYADTSARQGTYLDAPPAPCVIGYEVVGRVDALGPGVSKPAVGERVAALTRFGGYATEAVTMADATVPVGEDLDAGVAVAIPTQGATAWHCAEAMVRMQPGEHVLVHAAAGGVGSLLVQMAKRRGCVVYGTVGSPTKVELVRSLGVDHPILYRDEDFARAVKRLRGPEGLDVIFDSLGGGAVRRGFQLLAAGGRLVCFGAAERQAGRGQWWHDLRFALSYGLIHPIQMTLHSKSILGVNMLRLSDARPAAVARALQEVARLVLAGEVKPIVGGRFPASRIAEAHEFLSGRGSTGKIVVTWDS